MKAAIMLTTALLAGDVAPADARSGPVAPRDTLPTVTLAEALRRATRLDPDYVRALGQIDNAEWSRRAARLAFILPAITAEVDATRYSTEFFNVGTGQPQSTAVNSRLVGSYELFRWGKFTDLSATRAELEAIAETALRSWPLTLRGRTRRRE